MYKRIAAPIFAYAIIMIFSPFLHSGKKLTMFDPDQTAPIRLNQGLHYLQIASTSASFACIS